MAASWSDPGRELLDNPVMQEAHLETGGAW